MFNVRLANEIEALAKEIRLLREKLTTTPNPLLEPHPISLRVPIGEEFLWPKTLSTTYYAPQDMSLDVSSGDFVVHLRYDGVAMLTVNALAFRFRPLPLQLPFLNGDHPLSIRIEFDPNLPTARRPVSYPEDFAVVLNVLEMKRSELPFAPPPSLRPELRRIYR